MPDGIRAFIDWNKNGNYTGGHDNVTDDVRGEITCSFGRDVSTALTPILSGRGALALDNNRSASGTLRKYSPRNTASPLTGLVKPARPVLVDRVVSGVTWIILAGHTDDQPLNPDPAVRQVRVGIVDTLADFRGSKIATELYAGLRTGEVIDLILDAVGWTGGRDLDSGATVIPWWWEDGADALDAMQKVVASEGYPALLTVGTAGEVIFRDRHHRLTRAASTTSQQTWRGTPGAAEPTFAPGTSIDEAWQNVVNDVTIEVGQRRPQPFAPVWSTDESVALAASASRTVVVSTSDPFRSAVTPVADTDFMVLSGSVTSVSLSRTSGGSTSVTLTAGGGGALVQGLQVRAQSVPVVRTVQRSASDSASITDYGSRGLPSGMDPVWVGEHDAQALADLYVLQRKQPLPTATVRFVCGTGDEDRLTALLARDLSDRVTIVEPESVTSGAFFVDRIEHTIRGKHDHEIVFALEAAPASPVSPFILGTSTLNGSATLGY